MRHSFIALAFVLAAILIGCSNSKNNDNSSTEPDMPAFEQKFPQKSIWVHHDQNDSTEITFSSMEEAEWKLVHKVSHHEFCDAFVQVLLSDPSSMDYPFDSLSSENFCGIFKPAVSDDVNARFIGLEPDAAHQIPYMIVQYKNSGRVWIAEEGYPSENCFYCLTPDTVFTLNTGTSTLYLAWAMVVIQVAETATDCVPMNWIKPDYIQHSFLRKEVSIVAGKKKLDKVSISKSAPMTSCIKNWQQLVLGIFAISIPKNLQFISE